MEVSLPKVSVIIPTYNQRDFVHETIESVLTQTYENIEVIVTDDGSTDGTQEIIKNYAFQYRGKIRPVFSGKNTGIAANLNRGLAEHTGEFIAWLGGDDLMYPEKIKRQVELLRNRRDAIGCCHDAEVFESDSGKVLGLFSELYNGERGLREGSVELWFDANYSMLPSTVMFRSTACPDHGFDERLKYANDWLFDVEVFRKGKCLAINDVLTRYRRHARNVTGSPSARYEGAVEFLTALKIVVERYPELNKIAKKRRRRALLSAAAKMYAKKDFKMFHSYTKMLINDGAFFQAMMVYIGLLFFGRYLSPEIEQQPLYRSYWFKKFLKILNDKG